MTSTSGAIADSLFSAIPYSQGQYDNLSKNALSRGIDLYMKKDYAAAIKEFRRASGLSPFSENAAKALDYIAQSYLMDNNQEAAIKTYEEAIRIYPTRDNFYISLGDIYYKQGNLAEAEKQYTASIKLNADSPESRYSLGLIYVNTDRCEEAGVQFKEVVRLSPASSVGYYGLGQTYRRTGEYTDAISQLNKAIAVDKNFDNAYLELGYTYVDMGDMDQAYEQVALLKTRDSSLASTLDDYINNKTAPRIIAAFSTNNFSTSLGPNTPIADLNSALTTPQSEATFTMKFLFSKEMDPASVENIVNWRISRASGTNAGGLYNWGMPIPSTEVNVPLLPATVIYDPDSLSASVSFRILQNDYGDGTIDPSHIMFQFYGKDAYNNAMDLAANEYSGISSIA